LDLLSHPQSSQWLSPFPFFFSPHSYSIFTMGAALIPISQINDCWGDEEKGKSKTIVWAERGLSFLRDKQEH